MCYYRKSTNRAERTVERINLLGMCESVTLHVSYVEGGERTRIISYGVAASGLIDTFDL
jgi:hypothetical protein